MNKTITVVTAVLCPSDIALSVISQCMRSVRKAIDKVHGEYVIVDDCSAVGADFFMNISDVYFKNEKTLGVSASLNKGMKRSVNDFVVKLDSDYLVPENLFEILLKDWSDDCCFISPSYVLGSSMSRSNFDIQNIPVAKGGVYNRAPGEAPAYVKPRSECAWGGGILMFDRQKLAEIDYFDEGFGIGGAQDNDVIYRLLKKGHNWKWDNNVMTRHFASTSSMDKQSTQDFGNIRKIGEEYFKKKHSFLTGDFINKIYQKFNYKFEQ